MHAETSSRQLIAETDRTPIRRRWRIAGRVQGVGFRPFVFRTARYFRLTGSVWNDSAGVVVEAQGTQKQLSRFARALTDEAPAAASIRHISDEIVPIIETDREFSIRESVADRGPTAEISADLCICPECLAEIRDPDNARRFGYPLTNCMHCGPRFSIVLSAPYDRARTTMREFEMCPACYAEYENPTDRRFHAQPIACKHCGPKISLQSTEGEPIARDAILVAADLLAQGKIVAVKGIGGFHLAVRADDESAVARLRALKNRPAKPFALMCPNLQIAETLAHFSHQGKELLQSATAPIVLATRTAGANIADSVAPANHRLGIMLAYTPMHHLLFDALATLGVSSLVMTSANDVDEPLVFRDEDVRDRLAGLCDCVLLHDRPIQRSVDDSVVIDAPQPILARRSRGYAPEPIEILADPRVPAGIALGAEMKNTVAAYRDGQIILSQHLGNLTEARTFDAFSAAIHDLCDLTSIKPAWIAHDLHPNYLSTQHARHLATQWRVPLVPVQHHHAHAAALLAELRFADPVLAIVCDGTGFGSDQSIWGGELLVADCKDFRRVARLRPMLLPGGDAAARQPWRSALALLHQVYGSDFAQLPICNLLASQDQLQFVSGMLQRNVSCVPSSSMGRLFDALAALLGICRVNRYDAEAPAALEAAASQNVAPDELSPLFDLRESEGLIELDFAPLVRSIVELQGIRSVAELAMLSHNSLAGGWTQTIAKAADKTGLRTVALTGGVFCNALLGNLLTQSLKQQSLRVLQHQQVPPNDGGIAFGQAAVAVARWNQCK